MDNSKEAFDLLSAVMVVVNFIPLVLFFAVLLMRKPSYSISW